MTESSILQTEAELIRLSNIFAYCMDYHDYDQLIALFTPDALWDRVLHAHRGHDEIREALAERHSDVLVRHVTTNFYFKHISADEVRGVIYNYSHYGTYVNRGEAPVPFENQGFLLEFHDRYVRTDNGWLFAERVARPVLVDKNSPMMEAPKWRLDEVG